MLKLLFVFVSLCLSGKKTERHKGTKYTRQSKKGGDHGKTFMDAIRRTDKKFKYVCFYESNQ